VKAQKASLVNYVPFHGEGTENDPNLKTEMSCDSDEEDAIIQY